MLQLLACIGEVFTEGDDVCGVSMNLRAKNRCSVWTRTAANESKQVSCSLFSLLFADTQQRGQVADCLQPLRVICLTQPGLISRPGHILTMVPMLMCWLPELCNQRAACSCVLEPASCPEPAAAACCFPFSF